MTRAIPNGDHYRGVEGMPDTAPGQQIEDAPADIRRAAIPRLKTFPELGEIQQPERLIRRLMGTTSLVVIFGPPKCGKTFFTLAAAFSIASGEPFFDRKVTRGLVLYVAAEGGQSIHNRIAAYKVRHPDAEDLPFTAYVGAPDLGPEGNGAVEIIEAATLATQLYDMPVAAIVIDTLSRCVGGNDENSPEVMGGFIRNVDRVRDQTGATVVVVHHTGKDASRGMRGHSSLLGAVDTAIEVEKRDAGRVATVRAARDGAEGTEIGFDLEVVKLGQDDEGEPITSCIAVPVTEIAAPGPARLTATEQRALDMLAKAIEAGGTPAPASNHIPQGVTVAKYEAWRAYCYAGSVSGSESDEAKRKAFVRAATGLLEKGRIGKWQEFVWFVR